MYQTSLFFHLRTDQDRKNILKMFFKDWADTICNSEVTYSSTTTDTLSYNNYIPTTVYDEIIRVDFEHEEDAVAMKLKGIPEEFQKYLTII